MTSCTWQKETYNLYDNDTSSIFKSHFQISSSSTIYLENNTCKLYTPKLCKYVLPSCEPLLGFKQSQGEFITYQIGNASSKRLWLAIRYANPKGFELTQGDVLKLGRIRVKVRKIALKLQDFDNDEQPKCFDSLASQVEIEEELEQEAACRICFSGEISGINPLISPCECIGSIKYIHVDCLRHWLRSKLQTKTTANTVSYYWNEMICELCGSSLPASVYYLGNKLDLISIEYPKKPYLLLEEFTPENFNSCGIHLVTIDDGKTITLGRSPDVDFRISDISVSRKHAVIQFINNKFIIADNKSKFGTLVKLKKIVSLVKGQKISIQVERTMLHLCVRQNFSLKKCCRKQFKKIAPEWSYITQEGIEQSAVYLQNGIESHSFAQSFAQSGNSISYLDEERLQF